MQVERTIRGFEMIEFHDANGEPCSLQQSSAIDGTERGFENPGSSMLWLGPQEARPQIMASQAARLGVSTTETTGWIPYPIPPEVLLNTRMHLNREQVRDLIPLLQRWLETGKLSED